MVSLNLLPFLMITQNFQLKSLQSNHLISILLLPSSTCCSPFFSTFIAGFNILFFTTFIYNFKYAKLDNTMAINWSQSLLVTQNGCMTTLLLIT